MKEKENSYIIDYDMFSTIEIVKIIEFFRLIEDMKYKNISKKNLVLKYREYQNILNNKALEKKYDRMLKDQTGISIYEVMKPLINNENR